MLKTVKSAEDKASRGTRALEIAVDAVSNDIKSLDNATSGAAGASPEVNTWHSLDSRQDLHVWYIFRELKLLCFNC